MNSTRLTAWIVGQWRRPTLAGQLLLRPLSAVWWLVVESRRQLWHRGVLRIQHLPVPVIVVGNLTVGGSGKTPLVAYLAESLAARGVRAGIVSRGYGRRESAPRRVRPGDDPADTGDEPLMLAERTGLPVAVGVNRPEAARLLLPDCDLILSDDGLQHHALGRDVEIIVVDAAAGDGNQRLLPAGPMRESARHLGRADFVAVRDSTRAGAWRFRVEPGDARCLVTAQGVPLSRFAGLALHAVAAIGRPGRFFDQLEAAGLEIERHPFPDHYRLTVADLDFGDDRPVLMTEKDAVKCRQFADPRMWVVPATVTDVDDLFGALCRRLETERNNGSQIA